MIKNNNPGNIRVSASNWQGKIGENRGFVVFDTLANGYRALLINLYNVVRSRKVGTIGELGEIWAPSSEPGQTVNHNWPVNVRAFFGSDILPQQFTYDTAFKLAKSISRTEHSEFDEAAIKVALESPSVKTKIGTKFGWTVEEKKKPH